jgi:hypothetical protein
MRSLLIALFVTTAGTALASVPAVNGFPRDSASLSALDTAQLRIVRRAGAQCWHHGEGGFGARGVIARACVMNGTESMLANMKDPVLKAFSDALPLNARYNEYRPAYYWQRLVEK